MRTIVTFKVESFRRIPCPFKRDQRSTSRQATYIAICDIRNLPRNFPMDTNAYCDNIRPSIPITFGHRLR